MVINIKKILLFISIFMLFLLSLNTKTLKAESTRASERGYNISGLTYVSDIDPISLEVVSSKNTKYGTVGMWVATYKIVCKNTNDTYTAYYILLIESSISSVGKQNKYYYFRNKQLKVDFEFESKTKSFVDHHTEASEDAVTTYSKTFGVGIKLDGEVGSNGAAISTGVEGNLSFSNSQSYSSVNLVISEENNDDNTYHKRTFNYKFMNWKNGNMVSPNIGLINKKMVVICSVGNYDFNDAYLVKVTTSATIFKDAKWPRENNTLEKSISCKGINGIF